MSDEEEEEEEEEEESSTSKPLLPVEVLRKESRIRMEKSQSEIRDPNGKKSQTEAEAEAEALRRWNRKKRVSSCESR